jgi:hypothetical protein
MANEITITASIQVVNGNLRDSFSVGSKAVDQAAVGGPTPGYVTIGTSEETVTFGELGTKGYCVVQNLSTTNFIEWGFSTGVYGGKLLAGEVALFRLNSTSLFLKADTAACKVLIKGYEN